MKKVLILLLILLPLIINAQGRPGILLLTRDSLQKPVHLEDSWRFKAGDDKRWADKDLNDSAWYIGSSIINIAAGSHKKMGFQGTGWFRYYLEIDSSLVGYPLALEMQQSGASQIFIDGKLEGQLGRFTTSSKKGYYINGVGMPVIFSFMQPGKHVIAVKYENYKAEERYRKLDEEVGGFGMDINKPAESIDWYNSAILIGSVVTLISGSIFLALFLVHLILFLFYRESISNLLFSLFNLGFASFFLVVYLGMAGARSIAMQDASTLGVNISLSVSCFAISALVNNLFSKRRIRFGIITLICLLVIILSFIAYTWSSYLLGIIAIICALEAAIMVCIAIYKKIKGAKILGAGILFFVLFFGTITAAALIKGNLQFEKGILAFLIIVLAVLAIFSIPFSMSAYLAWDFAHVNRSLKKQLKQVALLSQKTLEQEQEKQLMLQNRKEELEQEVVARTVEVREQKEKIEQQHEALKAEKKKSDELLLNILPAEVAEELKEKGETKAQHFDHVSVLFTDFVNFTQIAERLSAEDLVAELHECFRGFDEIMERNGLEKIKTIGDAYLAVSGMPKYNEHHAGNAVKAGLEIIAFIQQRKTNKYAFEVRVGINSGPLVAGIVGVKKFAYDIWGDTVNTASRMESSGEAGKVNISESTFLLVRDNFNCIYRGKIEAKNKGAIDMYFVQ